MDTMLNETLNKVDVSMDKHGALKREVRLQAEEIKALMSIVDKCIDRIAELKNIEV